LQSFEALRLLNQFGSDGSVFVIGIGGEGLGIFRNEVVVNLSCLIHLHAEIGKARLGFAHEFFRFCYRRSRRGLRLKRKTEQK